MGKSGGDSTEDCSIGLTIRRRSMAELPEPARRKLVTLMRQAEDHRALAEVERIRANGMRARVTDVRNRLAASEVESEISPELRIAEQGLQEQEVLQQTRFERYSQTQRLITQINAWLASLPPTTMLVPVTSEIRSEGNYQQQVERLRREITERKAELLKVNAARAPVEDARRQVCRLVDTLSRAPSLNTDGGKLSVPSWQRASFGPAPFRDVIALLCWLDRDRIIAALDIELEKLPVDKDALPPEQRARRVSELETDIARLELEEEAVVSAASAMGLDIPRRECASPAAVLGVTFAKEAPFREAAE
jgi:hypothetical protein